MTLSFTHAKVAPDSDDGNADHVQSADWNNPHVLISSVGGVLANLTGAPGEVVETDTPTLQAWLKQAPPTVQYISGYGYAPPVTTTASVNINAFAEMEFMPMPIGAYEVTIKSLMLRLQSGSTGETCQLAIYSDLNGMPHALLGNTTDIPATASVTTLIADLLSEVTLTGQTLVWIAVNFATVTTKPQVVGMSTNASMLWMTGYSSPGDALALSQFGWRIAEVYGTWPEAITGTLVKMGTNVPLMGFVVA